ncbi:hypothetical protein ACFFJX_01285 [Pseudarcicella hirudinis]|uniref:hypothetical protein n=1 Tax=Pseudarcicella hirudinis TaxID=1079859 RepID=UPI0035EB7171
MSQTNTASASIIEQPSKTASSNLANWILLGVLALIWGSSFILVKKSLVLFDVLQVGSLRIFSAFLFFVPVFIYRFSKSRERNGVISCFQDYSGIYSRLCYFLMPENTWIVPFQEP